MVNIVMVSIYDVKCEYRSNPIGIGNTRPRFSYKLKSDGYGIFQQSRRIVVASSEVKLKDGNYDMWDSGNAECSNTVNITYQGKKLKSRQICYYKIFVRLVDGNTVESGTNTFEMGLLHRSEFRGTFIGYINDTKKVLTKGKFEEGLPSPHIRKAFDVTGEVKRARIYTTALGLYKFKINGRKITDDVFTPGWTEYEKLVQYQTYDITDALNKGRNVISVVLGDGWYVGCTGLFGREYYGSYPISYFCQIEIEYSDGTMETVLSDNTWKGSEGPIIYSDIFMGEYYDANKELPGWEDADFDDSGWKTLYQTPFKSVDFTGDLVAQTNPTMKVNEFIKPISIHKVADKTYIFDMGQNMVGWINFKLKGARGDVIRFKYGEMLNPDNTLYTENLRNAKATDYYVCSGKGAEGFETSFTFHGFKYCEVYGIDYEPSLGDLKGCVVYSSMDMSGHFECDDEIVNKLNSNILWGQKGNFLDVPTDCPQRDERLGWTGDTQVFCKSACYNMDMAAFYTKVMRDINHAQRLDGSYTDIVPYVNISTNVHSHTGNADSGNPAWAECGIILPYTVYIYYNDTSIINDNYHSMQKYIEYLINDSENFIRRDIGYGDWLSINDDTPKDLIGTAYFAYSAYLMEFMSRVTGRKSEADYYRELFGKVRDAFVNRYVDTATGKIHGDAQTCYILALKMKLVAGELKTKVIENLKRKIVNNNGNLSCGFVGVSYLLPMLSENKLDDFAYDILLQRTFPSWGYSIVNGATTIWERWNSYTKENGFGDVRMNSFNHYSLGSIAEWMYQYMGGIMLDENCPGYRDFIIRPHIDPKGRIRYVNVSYDSINGQIKSSWKIENGVFKMEFTVPANTKASVYVPKSGASGANVEVLKGDCLQHVGDENGYYLFNAVSGEYSITVR